MFRQLMETRQTVMQQDVKPTGQKQHDDPKLRFIDLTSRPCLSTLQHQEQDQGAHDGTKKKRRKVCGEGSYVPPLADKVSVLTLSLHPDDVRHLSKRS